MSLSTDCRVASLEAFLQARAFCPTGVGGGVKNDCSPGDGASPGDERHAPKPKWMGSTDANGTTQHGTWWLEKNEKQFESPGHGDITSHIVSLVGGDGRVKAFVHADLGGGGDDLYVNYAHVVDSMRGKGVYKSLLDSLSSQFRVVSDEQHNVATPARKAYESLGAKLDRYGHYVLEKKKKDSRAYCPTGPGGGQDNSCSSHDSQSYDDLPRDLYETPGDSPIVYSEGHSPLASLKRAEAVTFVNPKQTLELAKEIGIKSPSDIGVIGAATAPGSTVTIESNSIVDYKYLKVRTFSPLIPSDPSAGKANMLVRITPDKVVHYDFFDVGPSAVVAINSGRVPLKTVAASVMSLMAKSLEAAERNGMKTAKTSAAGNSSGGSFSSGPDGELQGYRLWPKFGFDGPADEVTSGTFFRQFGQKLLSSKAAERYQTTGTLNVQDIVATKQGEEWWNRHGRGLDLKLSFADKSSDGYKRYRRMVDLGKKAAARLAREGRSEVEFWEWIAVSTGTPSLEAFERRAMGTATNAGGAALAGGTDCGRDEGGKFGSGNHCAYQGNHKPPSGSTGSPAHDLTATLPSDVYSKDAGRLYGHGDPHLDEKTASIVRTLKDKPNAPVRIYRAVPKSAGDSINAGDWVTVNKDYARQHGESTLRGDYKIVSKTVTAKDIFNNGDSIHEWGYRPAQRSIDARHASLLAFSQSRDCGQDNDGKFSKGNTCASGAAAAAAKGAVKGGATGAIAGLVTGGPAGVKPGAVAGAVFGAANGVYDNQMRPTRVKAAIDAIGLTDNKVADLVAGLGGSPKSSADARGGTLRLTIRDKDGKKLFHVEATKGSVTVYPRRESGELTAREISRIQNLAKEVHPRPIEVEVKKSSSAYVSLLVRKGFRVAASHAAGVILASYVAPIGDTIVGDVAYKLKKGKA